MTTRISRGRAWGLAITPALCLLLWGAAPANAQCVGDCNGDGTVAINELILGVNIALGSLPVTECPEFANSQGNVDIAQLIKGVNNALNGCPAPDSTPTSTATGVPTGTTAMVTATATVTNTPVVGTSTPTVTPTMTPMTGIGSKECTLVGGPTASRVKLNAGTLQFGAFPMSGTAGITCGAEADGRAECTCEVRELNPIQIPGIGFVCISPSTKPCDPGVIDCTGGDVLGANTVASGNIGTCDSNTACTASCETHCAAQNMVVLPPGRCVGFCDAGARDGQSCNCDTELPGRCTGLDCPGGACNGPDNAQSHAGICQCQCIDRAAGTEKRPGELQCNLPTTLVVERLAPCGDGDILINVGSACALLSTGSATSVVTQANFNPSGVVPYGPCKNAQGTPLPDAFCNSPTDCTDPAFPVCGAGPVTTNGAPLQCSALATSASGLKLRGMLNFFGSTLGDLVSELYVDCQ